jgi:hypothetical protein
MTKRSKKAWTNWRKLVREQSRSVQTVSKRTLTMRLMG